MRDLAQRVRERSLTDRPGAFDDLLATCKSLTLLGMKHGQWEKLNGVFEAFDPDTDTPELLIAVLTATLCKKRYLEDRVAFIWRVRTRLNAEVGEERTDRILSGL